MLGLSNGLIYEGFISGFEGPVDTVEGCMAWYDFSDASTMYTDAEYTTNPSSDWDDITRINNKITGNNRLGNFLIQSGEGASSGDGPKYREPVEDQTVDMGTAGPFEVVNHANGHSGCVFNTGGTNWNGYLYAKKGTTYGGISADKLSNSSSATLQNMTIYCVFSSARSATGSGYHAAYGLTQDGYVYHIDGQNSDGTGFHDHWHRLEYNSAEGGAGRDEHNFYTEGVYTQTDESI